MGTKDSSFRAALAGVALEEIARSSRLRLLNHIWPALPLYRDDDVRSPAVAARLDGLAEAIASGTYSPAPAYRMDVPKAGHGTRRASLLTLEDRVVYEALTARAGAHLESSLAPPSVLFGPRGTSTRQRWWSFERSVLRAKPTHVVIADVKDLGASVAHEVVESAMLRAGVPTALAGAVHALLEGVGGESRGIPQHADASDRMITAVLSSVDRALTRTEWTFTRCSDDFRIGVRSESQGLAALGELREALAALGLELNEQKTEIVPATEYRSRLAGHSLEGWVWEKLSGRATTRLLHGRTGRKARALSGRLRGRGHDLTESWWTGAEPWEVARAIQDLARAADPSGLGKLPAVVAAVPVVTPIAAGYVRAMVGSGHVDGAVAAAGDLMNQHLLDYQRAWLLRALLPAARELPEDMVSAPREPEWTSHVERVRLLAASGRPAPSAPSPAPPPQLAGELEVATTGAEHGDGERFLA